MLVLFLYLFLHLSFKGLDSNFKITEFVSSFYSKLIVYMYILFLPCKVLLNYSVIYFVSGYMKVLME